MQINIRTAAVGAGAYTTVANDQAGTGDWIDFKAPQMTTEEYISSGYGAPGKNVQNMGNALWTVSIPIRKFYATNAAARQAIATLGALFAAGSLDLQVFDVTAADATYMPAASVGAFTPDTSDGIRGVAVYFVLKFTGPSYTVTAP